jgi:hypothetical protein
MIKGKTAGIPNWLLLVGGIGAVAYIIPQIRNMTWDPILDKVLPTTRGRTRIPPVAQAKTIETTVEGAMLFGVDGCTQQLADDESDIKELSARSQMLMTRFYQAYAIQDTIGMFNALGQMDNKLKRALTNWLICKTGGTSVIGRGVVRGLDVG